MELRGDIEAGYLDDVIMGQYTVLSEFQCQRLCLYRRLCLSYKYSCERHTINCVLFATDTDYANLSSDGCSSNSAACVSVSNSCASRPCGPAEVCVPSRPLYRCLFLPARCGDPDPVVNASVIVAGHDQGDVATVQCIPGYAVVPRNTATQLRCQVTSKWTTFQGTCVRAEFKLDPPERRFVSALPSNVSEGWAMCAQGVLTDTGQLFLNLQASEDNVLDVYFHLSLKYQFKNNSGDDVRWNTKVNGTFQNGVYLGPMPYVPGDEFSISMLIVNASLRVILRSHDTYDIPVADIGNLGNAKYCMVSGEANTTYVNFASVCEDL